MMLQYNDVCNVNILCIRREKARKGGAKGKRKKGKGKGHGDAWGWGMGPFI